ncbi:CBS domain-containing protein CBSCBSPB3 [Citrus sinensis]|nr:CBS domain-containing protein CBSCBSPB3 [Citrus sinensis]
MSSQGGSRRSQKRAPSTSKRTSSSENGGNLSKPPSPQGESSSSVGGAGGERTVKKLRLSKALTIPEGTIVSDACRRMASRRVDAVLLTDANALLSGIVTDKDITTRVIAEGLRPDQTVVSKIMTRNPIFVTSDSLAIEALQKMVQGKFRHLPVVENGEVIAILDITKCLYDAISRMEKAAEQGSAIAAAVEGVERQWGSNFSAPYAFIETLRERMFKPSLSTIITENAKVAIVSPSDPVAVAAKKMREFRSNSALIVTGSKIQGILTSKDVLMRVVAQNLSPELTLVEKVMTSSPECATMETTILDALHIMHDGKFLHLPVIDKDGGVAACLDVLQITHAAISMVESGSGAVNDMANTMMQKFWDSALALEPPEDYDTHSEMSGLMTSEGTEQGKFTYPSLGLGNSFAFKFEDRTENVDELLSTVMQRIGAGNDGDRPQLLYEDDEGDKVLLATDADLVGAISHARSVGLKVLRLHLDNSESSQQNKSKSSLSTATVQRTGWSSFHTGILVGAVALTSIGLLVYMKRSRV